MRCHSWISCIFKLSISCPQKISLEKRLLHRGKLHTTLLLWYSLLRRLAAGRTSISTAWHIGQTHASEANPPKILPAVFYLATKSAPRGTIFGGGFIIGGSHVLTCQFEGWNLPRKGPFTTRLRAPPPPPRAGVQPNRGAFCLGQKICTFGAPSSFSV